MKDYDEEMGPTLTTRSQSTATVVNHKHLSAVGYLISPAPPLRPHHLHREGKGVCPNVATHCVKDTRKEKKQKYEVLTTLHALPLLKTGYI